MISYDAMFDELEKIALGESGAETFKRQVEKARAAGTAKNIPFMEGLKRNVVATGRRLAGGVKDPKKLVSRLKWSVTNPAAPKWMRGAAALGIGLTAADAARPTRPGEKKSRLRRALSGAGGLLGGSAGRGLTGGLIGGTVGSTVGDLAGAAIDKVRGFRPPEG